MINMDEKIQSAEIKILRLLKFTGYNPTLFAIKHYKDLRKIAIILNKLGGFEKNITYKLVDSILLKQRRFAMELIERRSVRVKRNNMESDEYEADVTFNVLLDLDSERYELLSQCGVIALENVLKNGDEIEFIDERVMQEFAKLEPDLSKHVK